MRASGCAAAPMEAPLEVRDPWKVCYPTTNIAVVTQCMLKVNSEAHHHSPRSVAVALGRARVKFNELDLDGNGALEGDELVTLADWVWGQFHPSQQEFDREGYTQKLLSLLDGRLISRVED